MEIREYGSVKRNEMESERVNCYKCKNFYVTHEPQRPYGCKGMKFKSKIIPSRVVYMSSGKECMLFSPKK